MKSIAYGVTYHPEMWPEERWDEDIALMKKAGFNTLRLGSGIWSSLEMENGEFDLDWLDRFIEKAGKAGMQIILAVFASSAPVWMRVNDPEMQSMSAIGRRIEADNASMVCPTSPGLHAAVLRFTRTLGMRYGQNPYVAGWEIATISSHWCFCERCQAAFQAYLQKKYTSLDELNRRLYADDRHKPFSAWDQIRLDGKRGNPIRGLDANRFLSDLNLDFQHAQIEALRPLIHSAAYISQRIAGLKEKSDAYALSRQVDFAGAAWRFDEPHHDYATGGADFDLARSLKNKGFWVMKAHAARVNYRDGVSNLNRGEARAMAWQVVALGAEGYLFDDWRTTAQDADPNGGSLVDRAGEPRLFYEDAARLGKEFQAAAPLIADSTVNARVGIVLDYESRWSIDNLPYSLEVDFIQDLLHYYSPLAQRNINVDFVSPGDALDHYRLLILCGLPIVDDALVARLRDHLRLGGYLLITPGTGIKNRDGALLPSHAPGPLAEIAGVEAEETFALDEPIPVKGNWFEGRAGILAERLKIRPHSFAVAAARYGASNGWLDEQPALTIGSSNGGMVYTLGTTLDDEAQKAFMNRLIDTVNVPAMQSPPGVQVRTRTSLKGVEIYFVTNHTAVPQTVPLQWPALEHIHKQAVRGAVLLEPYETAILTKIGR